MEKSVEIPFFPIQPYLVIRKNGCDFFVGQQLIQGFLIIFKAGRSAEMYAVHDFVPWLAVDVAEFEYVPFDGVCREKLDHIHNGNHTTGLDVDLFPDAILDV